MMMPSRARTADAGEAATTETGKEAAARTIAHGRQATLHLAIHLDDGTEVVSTFDDEPLHCRIGDGTLAKGLEGLLEGLAVGEEMQILADGTDIYGPIDEGLLQTLPRADLPPDFLPEPGQVLRFETPGGQETAGTIIGADEDGVRVDFNHPLSRRGLRVRVKVLAIG
ncbi:peptidylprolyl isomerase [Thiohalocapsa marina]|uniref:Peptidyl-prolyl cis-trans isomerase n=2 Tax=Thiohalocapsa marina TaxID=424902 RepID=A0A5M8FSA2_9GAMM|nr:peptidylprolyl isomerase [Thiohalocapsa marina]